MLNQSVYHKDNASRYLLYIPPEATPPSSKMPLRQQMIHECHDALYSGHFGTAKTLNRAHQPFHWPNLHLDVADYCKTCIPCHRSKTSNRIPLELLQPIPIAFKPWCTISMDFITQLPKSRHGCDAIFVVSHQLTKRAHLSKLKTSMYTNYIRCIRCLNSSFVFQLCLETAWTSNKNHFRQRFKNYQ